MGQRILLVRHGRSAHVQRGWLDRAQFLRWREEYEAAGIDAQEQPPADLKQLASTCAVIASSPAARARESASLLAPAGRDVIASPLLAELELAPPNIGFRMPFFIWALLIGIRTRSSMTPELERAKKAAEWLTGMAERDGCVLAVTHGSFRSLLARQLVQSHWKYESERSWSHWSVWSLGRL